MNSEEVSSKIISLEARAQSLGDKLTTIERKIDEARKAEDMRFESQDKDIVSLTESLRSVNSKFTIAGIVAAIFGLGGAYGANVLSSMNSQIDAVSKKKDQIVEELNTVGEQNLGALEQKFKSLVEADLGITLAFSMSGVASADASNIKTVSDGVERSTYTWNLEIARPTILFLVASQASARHEESGGFIGVTPRILVDGSLCSMDYSYFPQIQGNSGGITVGANTVCILQLDGKQPAHQLVLEYERWTGSDATGDIQVQIFGIPINVNK